jgi:hypothetical protein
MRNVPLEQVADVLVVELDLLRDVEEAGHGVRG